MSLSNWIIINVVDSDTVDMINASSIKLTLKPEEHFHLEALPLDSLRPLFQNDREETKYNGEEDQIELTVLGEENLSLNEVNVDINAVENSVNEAIDSSQADSIEVLAIEGKNISLKGQLDNNKINLRRNCI